MKNASLFLILLFVSFNLFAQSSDPFVIITKCKLTIEKRIVDSAEIIKSITDEKNKKNAVTALYNKWSNYNTNLEMLKTAIRSCIVSNTTKKQYLKCIRQEMISFDSDNVIFVTENMHNGGTQAYEPITVIADLVIKGAEAIYDKYQKNQKQILDAIEHELQSDRYSITNFRTLTLLDAGPEKKANTDSDKVSDLKK